MSNVLLASAASADFIARIPHAYAHQHAIVSQGIGDDGSERLAVGTTTRDILIANAGVRLQRALTIERHPTEAIRAAVDEAYELKRRTPDLADLPANPTVGRPTMDGDVGKDLLTSLGKSSVERLVDDLLLESIRVGASDLHLQPLSDKIIVRRRIDGILDAGSTIPRDLLQPLIGRIKVLGRMDVAERLVPQDGRTTLTIGARTIDARISSMPTPHGERVVIRLLDANRSLQAFRDVGMPDRIAEAYLGAARKSAGIILVTGPTGSGKTTTLYATLRELDAKERNIMTIEDPIEYELDRLGLPISQSQVNTRKGVTFANGLRHILRQDPDIILVGEIRDAETAKVAIQSSLTGHLVFSTLHTNDAITAVTRLVDLGVEPYLVASSLSVVLAQRLVRRCCPTCGGTPGRFECPICLGMGFKGRIGLFELLEVDEGLRATIARNPSVDALRQACTNKGMITLRSTGNDLVTRNITTASEVDRVVYD